MEFLVNPNVSYVLLVLGFMIAILALFSPGTGVVEIAALFAMVLAGYGILNMPVNTWALAVLAISMFPFILALRKTQKYRFLLLGASVLAFLVGSALLFPWDGWTPGVNLLLILLLSSLTLGFAWLVGSKSLEAITAKPVYSLDRLIGMKGQVSSDIRGEGTVYVNGEEWSARSDTFIPAGSTVCVIGRQGLMLEVELVTR